MRYVLISLCLMGMVVSAPLALAQAAATQEQTQQVNLNNQEAFNFLKEIREILQRNDERFTGLLKSLDDKMVEYQKVEEEYDKALADLRALANKMGPKGEMGAKVEAMIQIAREQHAKLSASPNPKLKELAKRYKEYEQSLLKDKENLARVYGDVLRKIKLLEEEKEVAVEYTKAGLFGEAVKLVKKGVEELKKLDGDLAGLQQRLQEVAQNLPAAAQ